MISRQNLRVNNLKNRIRGKIKHFHVGGFPQLGSALFQKISHQTVYFFCIIFHSDIFSDQGLIQIILFGLHFGLKLLHRFDLAGIFFSAESKVGHKRQLLAKEIDSFGLWHGC